MLIWCLLHRESQMTVLMTIWHQHQSKNQVLWNHCVYSPTYLMLKIKHQNVVLELQNQNSEPYSSSPSVAQCVKSRILNKAIDSILSINTFEKQCGVIKCILKSPHIEDHMKNIGIDQSLCNRSSTNQNKNNTSNTDDIHSCVTPRKNLQCSGHIYNHSFNVIELYTTYCTCWVTHNN